MIANVKEINNNNNNNNNNSIISLSTMNNSYCKAWLRKIRSILNY